MNYFKNLYLNTFRIIITKLPFIPPKRSDKQIKVTRINKLATSSENQPHGQAHFILFVPLKIKRAYPSSPPPIPNDCFYTHIVRY